MKVYCSEHLQHYINTESIFFFYFKVIARGLALPYNGPYKLISFLAFI